MIFKNTKGFTLIELLVTISIIGLLSSIVLASLNSARLKAKDTAVVQEALQIRNLLEQEYLDSGSYTKLQGNWVISNAGTCLANAFDSTSIYATSALNICNAVNALVSNLSGNRFYVGSVNTAVVPTTAPQSYSIIIQLPSTPGEYYCLGHNGKSSKGPSGFGSSLWTNPGCWADNTNI